MQDSWIGVDLDGTLAKYEDWEGPEQIGEPVPIMIDRVKKWLDNGVQVKIITARASGPFKDISIPAIEAWCEKHLGQKLPVTASKDYQCLEIYDDRAVSVEMNTGRILKENWVDCWRD